MAKNPEVKYNLPPKDPDKDKSPEELAKIDAQNRAEAAKKAQELFESVKKKAEKFKTDALKSYKKEQIIFTIHTDIRVLAREVPNELVIANLQNPENLIDFIEQKAMYPGEKKYKLVFKLHDTRILIVVVVVNKNISVVTPIIRYRKWVRRNEN